MRKSKKLQVSVETHLVLNNRNYGRRYRKVFKIFSDAVNFDEHDYINEVSKKKPASNNNILSIAKDHYLNECSKYIGAKPTQKGFITTHDRANKFIS